MTREQLLTCALDIGEQMLISGAEVGRVELTIRYICSAYDCCRTDVFTITNSIVVSIADNAGVHASQTRRIMAVQTDLSRLHQLNDLSRRICAEKPDYDEVQEQIRTICAKKRFPIFAEAVGSSLIAFSFAVFFGGAWMDGLVAAGLGFGMRYLTRLLQMGSMNQIFINAVSSLLLSISAMLLVRAHIGLDANNIIIGNIMILIPGIALTNSLRDMISGDIMSGMLRFFDACLVAGAIAAGYILADHLLGGIL